MAARAAASRALQRSTSFEQDSDLSARSEGDLETDSQSEVDRDEPESDANAPRYAQFMDDSDLDAASDDSEEENETNSDHDEDSSDSNSDEAVLQNQMKNVPFSALVKARAQMANYSDDEGEDFTDLEPDEFEEDRQRLATSQKMLLSKGTNTEQSLEERRSAVKERLRQLQGAETSSNSSDKNDWDSRRALREARHREAHARQELEKRAHKHAPTEMSSKKPVSRRRNVVETSAKQIRDPRFESLSGSENKDLFAKSYAFLPEIFRDELATLKRTLAKLKKQEAAQAGPKARSDQALALRDERAKVEIALRRAEGLAGERERRHRESEVKGKIKAQNKERVEKGQLPFYPKRTEVRQMLLRDKYDRLSGGNQDGKQATGAEKKQLKKALERRRRKNAQKEKKDMPAGIGFAGSGNNAHIPKRKREWGGTDQSKRARP